MAELTENINKVKEFHEVFKISYESIPTAVIEEKEFMLRYNLMKEENEEYLDACKKGDLTEIADALGDKMYILFGTIIKHGLQHKIEEIFSEIHRSNMSKLDENNQPIYREDGKIMKSKRYFRPDIRSIIEK
jgi:predicted HAD superfamily Cof-like phosphohydrolase